MWFNILLLRTLNYQRAKEKKGTQKIACSNSTANALELCKRDNTNTTYAAIEQVDVQLMQKSMSD